MDTASLSPFAIDKRLEKGFESFAGLSARYLDDERHEALLNDVGNVTSPYMAAKWLKAEATTKTDIILNCLSEDSILSLVHIGSCAHKDNPHFSFYKLPKHKIFSNDLTDRLLDFIESSEKRFWKIQKGIFAAGGLVGAVALIANQMDGGNMSNVFTTQPSALKTLTNTCLMGLKYGAFANVAYALGGSLLHKTNIVLFDKIKHSTQGKRECARLLGFLLENPETIPFRTAPPPQRAEQAAAPIG